MSNKKWTRTGKALKKSKPSLFGVSTGFEPRGKGGPHRRDIDYNRADKRREERDVRREWN